MWRNVPESGARSVALAYILVNVVLNVHKTVRLIRDGEKGGGRGMEVGGEVDYIPIATLSPPE